MKKQNSIITAIVATLVVIVAVTVGTYVNDRMMEKVATKMESETMKDDSMKMDESKYNLAFLSGISYQPNVPTPLEFTVFDKNGKRLHQNDYKIEHEKRMHVIVVSSELSQFQHVHPVFDTNTNSFKLPDFAFPIAGNYRIYTDFTVGSHDGSGGHTAVQYQDVIVGAPSSAPPIPLGNPTNTASVNGTTIDLAVKPGKSGLERKLTFTLDRNGKAVSDLQKYLGALGHLVVIREGDLEYIHTHTKATDVSKQNGKVDFTVDFNQPGTYKAFVQFQRDGQVMTASYVITVK
jgi:hypothetical protein